MMNYLTSIFVLKPLNILAIALLFLTCYLTMRRTLKVNLVSRTRMLLITTIAWGSYAGWELMVLIMTPEANIRVDLLIIWPILAFLSIWSIFRLFRQV